MDCNIGTKEHRRIVKISKALSAEQRERYIKLLKEYVDIFAWSYEDLKIYDTSIIQHKVPMKCNVKPFKQKLRRINPALFPVIEKEVKKLLDAKIIIPLLYLILSHLVNHTCMAFPCPSTDSLDPCINSCT